MRQLKDRLLVMAERAELLLMKSIGAVREKDGTLAETVVVLDREVDRMEIDIEEDAIALIARHQPAASDLRFLIGAIKINNDLERIGDHAVNIAQSAIRLAVQADLKPLVDLPRMADLTVSMLRDSLKSFVSSDPEMARRVCKRDDEVDTLNRQFVGELAAIMKVQPETVDQCIGLILISRNLERIADLATNISEDTIYICQAKVIKHRIEESR
jgi:phosphate transport system protein